MRATSGSTVPRQNARCASLIIRIRVVARDAEQHRRHAQRQRDLARGGVLGLDEVHVLRAERQRLPVEPAFQAAAAARRSCAPWKPSSSSDFSRANCSPVRLPLLRRVDERARGPRRVVEQRLVPGAGRVVDVDRLGRRLDRAHAVVVVDGMEQAHVQDRAHAGTGSASKRTERPPAEYSNASGQPSGPGITFMRSGRSTCSSRRRPLEAHRLHVGVAGDQQEAVPGSRGNRRSCGRARAAR